MKLTREDGLMVLFGVSMFIAFALSFSLFSEQGRPLLFVAMVSVGVGSLWLSRQRLAILGGFALFVLIRLLWVALLHFTR